jgi:Xaa-Pro aminopeptidase
VNDGNILELARTDRRGLFDAERLRTAIQQANLDAVVAMSGVNVTYTSGVYTRAGGSVLQAVVTTADGKQGLVVNEADGYYFREYSWVKDVRTFRIESGPREMATAAIGHLADILRDLGAANGRIGLEMGQLPSASNDQLRAQVAGVQWEEAGPVFEYTRLIKTPQEVELFRQAAIISLKAVQTAWAVSRPGDTEKRVAARMQSTALELGADGLAHCHLHAGVHSTIAHTIPIEKPFLPGEVIHIDFGAVFGGYQTDLSRNAVVVNPNPRQERIYKHLWEIQHKLFDKVRPGVAAGELWDLSQQEINRAGLVHPWGTMGHGTGLAVHEGFEVSRGSKQVLEPGMLMNLEPSHIEPGDARYHIEDTVLVTSSGYELLSDLMDTPTMTVIR